MSIIQLETKVDAISTSVIFFDKAILKEACANPSMDYKEQLMSTTICERAPHTSSVLYMAIATPLPLKSYTFMVVFSPPFSGEYTSCSLPGPGAMKSVDRYWKSHIFKTNMHG